MKDGIYVTENGIEYEVYKNQIMVEHKNGFYGCLYGKSSMSIFKNNKEVLHTGSRTPNTPEELYDVLETMPQFLEMVEQLKKE